MHFIVNFSDMVELIFFFENYLIERAYNKRSFMLFILLSNRFPRNSMEISSHDFRYKTHKSNYRFLEIGSQSAKNLRTRIRSYTTIQNTHISIRIKFCTKKNIAIKRESLTE